MPLLQAGRFAGRSVLDMACGDGFYTIRFWDYGKPYAMVAVDAAHRAVEVANTHKQNRPIQFVVGDVHRLPWRDNSFDTVLIQSILHHDNDPVSIIHEPYEKSYTSFRLKRWVKEAGGKVVYQKFAGFVPMFCPGWLARTMKTVEPVVEGVPLLNTYGCSVVILVAVRST